MKVKVLGSSSSGNCYILSTPTGSLLLDCGLPWRQIQQGLNFDIGKVVGALISHEHQDHAKAVIDVMRAGIDCYMSKGTAETLGIEQSYRCQMVEKAKQFDVADFKILSFDTEHDCAEPLGFLIQYKPTREKLLYLTDSYYCKYKFKELNYIMIECNYIKETLDENIAAGRISEAAKPRLLQSHFSLDHVKQFLQANDLSECRKIILLHLSDYNSDSARMVREIGELTDIDTIVAEVGQEIELELWPY